MRNPEEAIDKVLTGLREVEAPAGLELRILQRLDERSAQPSTSWLRRSLPLAALGALACGAVVALVVRPVHKAVSIAPAVAGVVTPPLVMVPAISATPERQHRTRTVVFGKAPQALPHVAERGFPAPPLPLTAEEKLLLRVAQGGVPTSVVVLDPQALAEREAATEKEFRERMDRATETVSSAQMQATLKNFTMDEGARR